MLFDTDLLCDSVWQLLSTPVFPLLEVYTPVCLRRNGMLQLPKYVPLLRQVIFWFSFFALNFFKILLHGSGMSLPVELHV